MLIKDIIDRNASVALFTRPRRFGKTSAMKMLRSFFEKTDEDTSYLFKDKKIWQEDALYREKQGKYPIIYLTFKDHKARTWEDAALCLRRDLASEVSRHKKAVLSQWSESAPSQEQLTRVMNFESTIGEAADSLGLLAAAIHSYYGVKPIILIDEYDMPISSASMNGYYDEMVLFMRVFLSSAMKDNEHVEMGLMTGVLRVAKEGILSGLNNLAVWTVFDNEFSQYFGFTKDEVVMMAEYYGVPEKINEICKWYDGYNFGGRDMYNPWSVLNYFARSCTPNAYWLSTSSNDLITTLIKTYPHHFEKTLEKLLDNAEETDESIAKKGVIVPMVEELGPYQDVFNAPETLYALLVSTGYLKIASSIERDTCAVRIPNRELVKVFQTEIKAKISRAYAGGYRDIDLAIRENDMPAL